MFYETLSLLLTPTVYIKEIKWEEKFQTEWDSMGNGPEYEKINIYGFK